MPAPAADALYAALLVLDRTLIREVKGAWFALQLKDLQGSFAADFIPRVVPNVVRAQTAAAAMGASNMTGGRVVAPKLVVKVADLPRPVVPSLPGLPGLPALPEVVPAAFSGVASDGRSLTKLLIQPLLSTYVNLDNGMPSGQALSVGMDSMDRILTTQIQDAARIAGSVALAASTTHTYYVRVVEPSACDRCAILAGRRYKWSTGFLRHPHCRCLNVAETETTDVPSVKDIVDQMSPEERVRTFGVAGAAAIDHGADPAQIVNARRGMSTTELYGQTLRTTTTGAAPGQVRLMPESILALSNGDRAIAVDLFRRNGFIR